MSNNNQEDEGYNDGSNRGPNNNDGEDLNNHEGAVGGVQPPRQQPPWSAFPDLVRVQTSPNAGADTVQSRRDDRDDVHQRQVGNPPDVSLMGASSSDFNLVNSHRHALPDMASDAEARSHRQEQHVSLNLGSLRGVEGGCGARFRRTRQPGSLASLASHSVPPNYQDGVNNVQQRASFSDDDGRMASLEHQVYDLREQLARQEQARSVEVRLVLDELEAIRNIVQEQPRHSGVAGVNLPGGGDALENRLENIETLMNEMLHRPSSFQQMDSAGLPPLENPSIQQVLDQQFARQAQRIQQQNRRMVRSLAESFQVAMMHFLQSIADNDNNEGGPSGHS